MPASRATPAESSSNSVADGPFIALECGVDRTQRCGVGRVRTGCRGLAIERLADGRFDPLAHHGHVGAQRGGSRAEPQRPNGEDACGGHSRNPAQPPPGESRR